ncbi:hypothetical protein CEXT_294171 [Caerostris extrusa]|uniref:Uncharacterized protein n=1 Tax=Caerostris extrusa TaxID=172846 RepID=A0AAV4S6X5_CAEEX|nr:hypothetical protein CEXT_294171 [Caerostris extrusa]
MSSSGEIRRRGRRKKLFCKQCRRDQRTISVSMEEYSSDFLEALRLVEVVLLVVTNPVSAANCFVSAWHKKRLKKSKSGHSFFPPLASSLHGAFLVAPKLSLLSGPLAIDLSTDFPSMQVCVTGETQTSRFYESLSPIQFPRLPICGSMITHRSVDRQFVLSNA